MHFNAACLFSLICIGSLPMKIYQVGGAVRDRLLRRPVSDCDYVVVGATPEMMCDQGYKPVGRDFPVFLHPETNEEYALARTERKSAPGYHGFTFHAAPEVTLKEDLLRRDLTINAMAVDETGELVDPFGGQRDLASKILRHVSPAFSEDPVRILRIARFAARFGDFFVADETLQLMRGMVQNGEVDHLVAERIWQELARGLMEAYPRRMIEVLRDCGALKILMPEVDRLFGVPQRPEYHPEVDTGEHVLLALQQTALRETPLPVRFAVLVHDLGKGTTPRELWPRHHGHEQRSVTLAQTLCKRLKVPGECRDAGILTARYHGDIGRAFEMRAPRLVRMLEAMDALRRPERFKQILTASHCDSAGRKGYEQVPFEQTDRLLTVLEAMRSVDAAGIAQKQRDKAAASPSPPADLGAAIREQLFQARVKVVREVLAGS